MKNGGFRDVVPCTSSEMSFITRLTWCHIPEDGILRDLTVWVSPIAGLDEVENRKSLTLPRLELQPLCRPAHSHLLH
jgi:hypothetical protein